MYCSITNLVISTEHKIQNNFNLKKYDMVYYYKIKIIKRTTLVSLQYINNTKYIHQLFSLYIIYPDRCNQLFIIMYNQFLFLWIESFIIFG